MDAVEQKQLKNAEVPGLPSEGVSTKEPVAPLPTIPGKPGKDIVIKRATFGDETSTTDVTSTLVNDLDANGYVKVTADQTLIPMFDWKAPKKVNLDRREQQFAEDIAVKECGGASNKSCVELRKQQKMALMLKEKEGKATASDKIVKGRRLTVTYVDENGQEKTAVVPDGNEFQAGDPKKKGTGFSLAGTIGTLIGLGAMIVAIFGWVYSVVATYRTILEAGYIKWVVYAATAAAIFIPYSGFFIMFGFFFLTTVIKSFKQSQV